MTEQAEPRTRFQGTARRRWSFAWRLFAKLAPAGSALALAADEIAKLREDAETARADLRAS